MSRFVLIPRSILSSSVKGIVVSFKLDGELCRLLENILLVALGHLQSGSPEREDEGDEGNVRDVRDEGDEGDEGDAASKSLPEAPRLNCK